MKSFAKTFFAILLSVAFVIGGLTSTTTIAYADTSVGAGSTGNMSLNGSTIKWFYVTTDAQSTAFSKLSNKISHTGSDLTKWMNSLNDFGTDLASTCYNASAIYYLLGKTSNSASAPYYVAYSVSKSGSDYTDWDSVATLAGGRASTNTEKNNIKSKIADISGVSSYSSGLMKNKNIVLMCTNFSAVDTSWDEYTTQCDYNASADVNSTESVSYTSIYSYSSSVRAVISASTDAPLEDQAANKDSTTITPFGSIYKAITDGSYNSMNGSDYDALKNSVIAAKSATTDKPVITLSDKNKKGLTAGGVLNIIENALPATINLYKSVHIKYCNNNTYRTTYEKGFDPQTGEYTAIRIKEGPTKVKTGPLQEQSREESYSASGTPATSKSTGFWQIISVHCNLDDLNKALDAYGVEGTDYTIMSQTTDDSGSVNSVIYTKSYTTMPTGPDRKVFGYSDVNNAALAATGSVGFYNKECSLQCSLDPNGSNATTSNGAKSNASITGALEYVDSKGGAVLEDDGNTTNSNYLEIFRDNKERTVTVNVAYPVNSGTFTYNGAAPISTTVVASSTGTPSTQATSTEGGVLSVIAKKADGTEEYLFNNKINDGGDLDGGTSSSGLSVDQNDFGINPYSSTNAENFSGFARSFIVGGTWASETNRPVILNIKWEYSVGTKVTVPAKVGFTSSSESISSGTNMSATTVMSRNLDVRCYAEYGTYTSDNTDLDVHDSTGTNSTNSLDSDIISDSTGDDAYKDSTNLVIKFIRGVAE